MSNLTGSGGQHVQDDENCEDRLLCLKIQALLEEMFSDSYLAKDGFLLKHVQKNKMGYINLKLLACLKKIKALTTNRFMTLAAAECSDLLEVNEECTKVRRKKPLPKWLLCSPTSRFLLLWNASAKQGGQNAEGQSPEYPSLLLGILQKFGITSGCTSVWILHRGEELPKELQCYAKRHKELGQHLCAVVKFESLEATRRAYNTLKAENEKGLCVVPLGSHSAQHFTNLEPTEEKEVDQPVEETESKENQIVISTELIQEEPCSAVTGSGETGDSRQLQERSNDSKQGAFDHYNQSSCSLNQRYRGLNFSSGDCNKESSRSPWVLKRKSAANAFNPERATHPNAPCLRQRVLRQPFGPDGRKGFSARGQRLNSAGCVTVG